MDSGRTWMVIDSGLSDNILRLYDIYSFVVDNAGNIFAGTDAGGILRSTNNGDSWEPTNVGMTDPQVSALGIDRNGQIYAATWPGVGDGSIYRSQDDGNTWVNVCMDLTHSVASGDSDAIRTLTITPNGDVFVGTGGHGIFRSTDSGQTWSPINAGLNNNSNIGD